MTIEHTFLVLWCIWWVLLMVVEVVLVGWYFPEWFGEVPEEMEEEEEDYSQWDLEKGSTGPICKIDFTIVTE